MSERRDGHNVSMLCLDTNSIYAHPQLDIIHTHAKQPKNTGKTIKSLYFHHCNRQCATASAINKKKMRNCYCEFAYSRIHTQNTHSIWIRVDCSRSSSRFFCGPQRKNVDINGTLVCCNKNQRQSRFQ